MLVQKKIKNSKRLILGLAIILILGVIGYLFYTNFLTNQASIINPNAKVKLTAFSKINPGLADDFLTKAPYTNLILPVQLPVTVNQTGRPDPFLILPFSLLRF